MTVSTRRGGRLKKLITVYTNIPGKEGTTSLTIQGEIWRPVDAKPQSASFGRLTPDVTRSGPLPKKLMIVNNMEADAKLADVRSTNPAFQAQTRVIEPGRKYELTVSVVSPLQAGNNNGKIEMSTGIKEMPTLSVPVHAYVMSDVDVNPNKLTLREQRPRDMSRQFIVRNNTKQPMKISDLEVSDPALTVALEETTPGRMFKITIDVPTGYHAPQGGDKITFKTDSPMAPLVTIPITEFGSSRRTKAGTALPSTRVQLPSGERKQVQPPAAATGAGSGAEQKPAPGGVKPKEAKPVGG